MKNTLPVIIKKHLVNNYFFIIIFFLAFLIWEHFSLKVNSKGIDSWEIWANS